MQTEHRFPPYRPPWGLPASWRDDVSGALPVVVSAYHAAALGQGPPLTSEQLELLRSYLDYVINAPCWRDTDQGEIADLRRGIASAQTIRAIDDWLDACLEIGIDPL